MRAVWRDRPQTSAAGIFFACARSCVVVRQTLYSVDMKTQPLHTTAKVLGVALVFAATLGWSQPPAPSQDNSVTHDMKAAGHDTKVAAKDTGHAVKKDTLKATHATEKASDKAAHATAKDTKKVAHATDKDTKKAAHATAKGTKKAWDKTKSTTEGAFHGAKEGAEKKTN